MSELDDDVKSMFCTTALGDEFLAEIGRITANFALLEIKLIKLIYFLLGSTEEMALAVTSEKSFNAIQDLAASLVYEHIRSGNISVTWEVEIREILKRASLAEQKRNVISHSLWGSKSASEVIRTKYTSKRKKGLLFQREVMTADDFHSITNLISVAAYDVDLASKTICQELTKSGELPPDLHKSKLSSQ